MIGPVKDDGMISHNSDTKKWNAEWKGGESGTLHLKSKVVIAGRKRMEYFGMERKA